MPLLLQKQGDNMCPAQVMWGASDRVYLSADNARAVLNRVGYRIPAWLLCDTVKLWELAGIVGSLHLVWWQFLLHVTTWYWPWCWSDNWHSNGIIYQHTMIYLFVIFIAFIHAVSCSSLLLMTELPVFVSRMAVAVFLSCNSSHRWMWKCPCVGITCWD